MKIILCCVLESKYVINTPLGSIKGEKKYESIIFNKVRYAEPPLKHLRFQKPQPVKPWNSIWDATQPLPKCIQSTFTSKKQITEDCLSVYTIFFLQIICLIFKKNKPDFIDDF